MKLRSLALAPTVIGLTFAAPALALTDDEDHQVHTSTDEDGQIRIIINGDERVIDLSEGLGMVEELMGEFEAGDLHEFFGEFEVDTDELHEGAHELDEAELQEQIARLHKHIERLHEQMSRLDIAMPQIHEHLRGGFNAGVPALREHLHGHARRAMPKIKEFSHRMRPHVQRLQRMAPGRPPVGSGIGLAEPHGHEDVQMHGEGRIVIVTPEGKKVIEFDPTEGGHGFGFDFDFDFDEDSMRDFAEMKDFDVDFDFDDDFIHDIAEMKNVDISEMVRKRVQDAMKKRSRGKAKTGDRKGSPGMIKVTPKASGSPRIQTDREMVIVTPEGKKVIKLDSANPGQAFEFKAGSGTPGGLYEVESIDLSEKDDSDHEQRLERLEAKIDRLERLLEKTLERLGG